MYRDPAYEQLRDCDLVAIEAEAREQRCELIHLLTIDGRVRNWLRPRKPRQGTRIPIVGTYYLFNNLWGLRGLIWMFAIRLGYIDKILISDPFIKKRWLVPGLRKHLGFIPDPWCREEFPYVDQVEARTRLGLPLDKKLVLVFGEISQRKGVKRILAALQLMQRDDLLVLFAGRIKADAKMDIERVQVDAEAGKKLLLHDRHIAEADVSAYFYAADAVLSDYPKWFKVSSGVFTRALASGRVAIIPRHGINYKVASALGVGLTYRSECVLSLAKALDSFQTDFYSDRVELCEAGHDRESLNYIKEIKINYDFTSGKF